jgi:hypothetical protein
MQIRPFLLPALWGLSACSSLHAPESREIFDEQTGNTYLVVGKPIVFARQRTDVAAHARDYATLVAVEVDHSGDFSDYLLLYRWSTVDPRMSAPPDHSAGELRILTEGRVIDLKPLENVPVSVAGRWELHVPKHGNIIARAYPVDASTLRFIATSGKLVLRMPEEPLDLPFGLWGDGRQALGQFVQRSGAP